MVIYDPRLPKEKRGKVRDEMVLNVDLPTTFLDWAGAPRPAGYEGQSLAPLVNGTASGPWRSHFFCEHVDLQPTLTWEGVRTNSEMYARYFDQQPVSEFLHDLKADPDELKNLASDASAATTLTKLRALCDQEMNARSGPLPPMNQRVTKPAGKKKKKA
jgi:arylsulfatase A-like enzyme